MPRLRTLAIVLAIVCTLVVAPGAWPGPTLTEFGCDYASGVNGSYLGVPQIVGFDLSGKPPYGWWGLTVTNPTSGCGTNFTITGASTTEIIGVSSSNTMVGFYKDAATGFWRGFISQGGWSATTFSVNNSAYTRAAGVSNYLGSDARGNKVAWVVGQYQSGGTQHGFVVEYNITASPPTQEPGTLVTFDVTGAQYTIANGINDSGEIVGKYADPKGNQRGFILTTIPTTSGTVDAKTVNCAGASGTTINGISNGNPANPFTPAAIIVGATGATSKGYAFYAPEPASSTSSWSCTQVPVTGSGSPWVSGIDSKGQYMVGHGGRAGNFLYQLF